MIITYNSGWKLPGEQSKAEPACSTSVTFCEMCMNAALGIGWMPLKAVNDNHLLSLHRAR